MAIREILSLIGERSVVREAWDVTFLIAKCFCGFHVINTYVATVVLVSPPSPCPIYSKPPDGEMTKKDKRS